MNNGRWVGTDNTIGGFKCIKRADSMSPGEYEYALAGKWGSIWYFGERSGVGWYSAHLVPSLVQNRAFRAIGSCSRVSSLRYEALIQFPESKLAEIVEILKIGKRASTQIRYQQSY